MRLSVIAVGRVTKQAGIRSELDDYFGRIRRYAKCDEVELKDGNEAEVTERFRKAIPARARTVALEVNGDRWASERLAKFLGDCDLHAVSDVAFLIGGSYGLPAEISKAADRRLSLSEMTLPHRLARLVLAEQLYRGFTILRNEPYSH